MAVAVVSIAMFFWWGLHFQVFGGTFRLDVATVGFFGWIAASAFGAGYMLGGWRSGAMWVGGFLLALAGAGLIGLALGNYG
jgi:hypothetical protein